jgi:hypothetical protein
MTNRAINYLLTMAEKKCSGLNLLQAKLFYNGFGLGEGGLVGCSILAECFCPLLPNPCYA